MGRTIDDIATELSVDRPTAGALLRVLRHLGVAQFRGERPSVSGYGKGAHVYDVKPGAAQAAFDLIFKLEPR